MIDEASSTCKQHKDPVLQFSLQVDTVRRRQLILQYLCLQAMSSLLHRPANMMIADHLLRASSTRPLCF